MLLLTQQNSWSRRDSKKLSEKSYKSDNRRSVRKAMQRIIDKAKRIKEEKNNGDRNRGSSRDGQVVSAIEE